MYSILIKACMFEITLVFISLNLCCLNEWKFYTQLNNLNLKSGQRCCQWRTVTYCGLNRSTDLFGDLKEKIQRTNASFVINLACTPLCQGLHVFACDRLLGRRCATLLCICVGVCVCAPAVVSVFTARRRGPAVRTECPPPWLHSEPGMRACASLVSHPPAYLVVLSFVITLPHIRRHTLARAQPPSRWKTGGAASDTCAAAFQVLRPPWRQKQMQVDYWSKVEHPCFFFIKSVFI